MHEALRRQTAFGIERALIKFAEGRRIHLPICKFGDELALDNTRIDGADHDDFDPIRAIIFAIKCHHTLRWRSFDDLSGANGVARGIEGLWVK